MSAIRTFIAIELSEVIRAQISDVTGCLQESLSGIRWVAAKNLHLTFKFLGDVEVEKLENICSIVQDTAKDFAPFALSFSGLGAFPNLRRPRVIWVGVEMGAEELVGVHKAIETALVQAGFPKDDKAFRPHLTVGRVKSKKRISGLGEILSETEVGSDAMTVDHIAVIKSDLTPDGPIYTPMGRYELSG